MSFKEAGARMIARLEAADLAIKREFFSRILIDTPVDTGEARGGKLYDSRWGKRQQGEGQYAESARALFDATCKRLGLNARVYGETRRTFQRPPRAGDQMKLF